MNRSRIAWIAGGIFALFLILALWPKSSPSRPVVVASLVALSGPYAEYGLYMRRGAELAYEEAVATGAIESSAVRYVAEDATHEPAKALSAFQKLLTVEQPAGVIAASSGIILAIKPLANQRQVVILNPTAIAPEIEDADDYVFSIIPNADMEGRFLAEVAVRDGRTNIGVIYRNDPSGLAFRAAFSERVAQLGATVSLDLSHNPNEQDFRPLVRRISSTPELEVVFMASFGLEVAAFLKQAREQGVRTPLITYATFYQPKVLEVAGDAAEGVLFSAPAFDPEGSDPAVLALRKRMKERYGQDDLNYYVVSHYDAMMLMLTAIASGAQDGKDMRTFLANLQSYDGLSGTITFDAHGAGAVPLVLYRVTEGRFVRVSQD